MAASPLPGAPADPSVPFERVAVMVRHLSHDVRNGLNSMDLQAAYATELVGKGEAAEELQRLRNMITSTAKLLQTLSGRFWVATPQFITYSAKIFLEDFRDRLARMLPEQAPQVAWEVSLADEAISVDLEMMFSGLSELFKNAFQFAEAGAQIVTRASAGGRSFIIELREPKTSVPSPPETWGREPLVSTKRDGFGLGLFHARRILAAHQADVAITHDPAAALLTTRIALPLAA